MEPDFRTRNERKKRMLAEMLEWTSAKASEDGFAGVAIENGRLAIAPRKSATPDEARESRERPHPLMANTAGQSAEKRRQAR
jgi:hypothetical protein